MHKRPIGYVPGKGVPYNKKVKKNPRYANVQGKLSGKTGKTAQDYKVLSNKYINKRKGETFKRLKCSTVAKLLKVEQNFESVYNYQDAVEREQEDFDDLKFDDNASIYSVASHLSKTSNFTFVTVGTQQLDITDQSQFLILDVRNEEDYDQFHMKEAINYPAPNIKRDKTFPLLQKFKNKENKKIIFYHFDERLGTPVGKMFYDAGYDNTYLVSGGIEEFAQQFPNLVEGQMAPQQQMFKKQKQMKNTILKRSNWSQHPNQSKISFKKKEDEIYYNQQQIPEYQQQANLPQFNQNQQYPKQKQQYYQQGYK